MLYEFVTANRDAIVARTRISVERRPWPRASSSELEHGLPLFLTQLVETLRWEHTPTPFSTVAISASATHHGRDLFALGFTVSQVVHDYGDICQAITELATERGAPITTDEFRVLNRCLDTAIAEAVTEHARVTSESRSAEELERMGRVAHEARNMLNTSLLAFDVVKRGAVGVNGNTGAVLGRSLTALRDLIDNALTDIRTAGSHHRPELVSVASLLSEIAIAARLQAEYSGIHFAIQAVDSALTVHVDQQLLSSAITNLLSNAFKYTPPGGDVIVRAYGVDAQVAIEVADSCGGIAGTHDNLFDVFGERRGKDRTGLGMGLSIARKAVRAQGGNIRIVNRPGEGCTFVIEVPAASLAVASFEAGQPAT